MVWNLCKTKMICETGESASEDGPGVLMKINLLRHQLDTEDVDIVNQSLDVKD